MSAGMEEWLRGYASVPFAMMRGEACHYGLSVAADYRGRVGVAEITGYQLFLNYLFYFEWPEASRRLACLFFALWSSSVSSREALLLLPFIIIHL